MKVNVLDSTIENGRAIGTIEVGRYIFEVAIAFNKKANRNEAYSLYQEANNTADTPLIIDFDLPKNNVVEASVKIKGNEFLGLEDLNKMKNDIDEVNEVIATLQDWMACSYDTIIKF